MTSYSMLMPKVMGPFAFESVQSHTLAIDGHGIQNTMSFDRAMLAPGSKLYNSASQRFLVEKDPQTDLITNGHNTGTESTEYAGDQIVSHESPRDDPRYQVCWYKYLPE